MKALLKLLPYFSRHKKKFLLGFLFVLISDLFDVVSPLFVGNAVDKLSKGQATASTLLIAAALILGTAIVSGVFFFLVRQTIIVASREIEFDLRNDFLAHIEKLSARFFQNTPQGDVMAYATNDISAVRNFIGPAVMYSADTIATAVLVLTLMLSISPVLSLIIIAPLPIMSWCVYLVGKRVHPLFDGVQAHYADLSSRVTESIGGTRVVKAYVREEYEKEVFDDLSRGYFLKNMRLIKVQGLMMPIIVAFMGISFIFLVLFGGRAVINHTLTIGEMTEFVMYLAKLTWPFIAVGFVTNMIQRAAASMQRLQKIFDTEPEIKDADDTDWSITSLAGDIEFQNVSFRYAPDLEPALKNVSLRIPSDSSLAIIGRTGSGKSSLVGLLARLYDVTEGSITIGGRDIREIPLDTLRSSIGFVTQETFLFSESIAENIAFGASNGTMEVVEDAAKAADIYDNILDFPNQFETMLGERGITLSGGQKQRTAIARAIARDPEILILDDAMSAVDTSTEERILKNLKRIMQKRTSILISHRVSTVKEADQIVILDNGEIRERGTHEELLNARGVYHDLYRKQLLEEALENA